jgi:ubiquinone/menaquinone biosynthesis C-methylase UbiE
MSESERIRRLYDERAATYDRSLGLGDRLLLGGFRRAYGSLLTGATLEIGIGSGLNLPFYNSAVSRAAGVDLSLAMLCQASERAASLGIAIALVQADAEALPFPAAAFDTVAISLALCTIPDPEAALREIARVCRPQGHVVLLEHVRATARPLAVVQRLLSPLNEGAIGCHLDRDTFGLARALGFTIERQESRLWDAVRLAVARPPGAGRATFAGME